MGFRKQAEGDGAATEGIVDRSWKLLFSSDPSVDGLCSRYRHYQSTCRFRQR